MIQVDTISTPNISIALIRSDEVLIRNGQEALDLIATVRYEYQCNRMILKKEALSQDFFDLKSGLAGEIMQKHINYEMPLAIVGKFDSHESKSLKALIHESNRTRKILFLENEEDAIKAMQE